MSDRLHVATRKGLFTINRTAAGWQLAAPAFLGENCTMVLRDPRNGVLYVALHHGHFGAKLQRSTDDGKTFEPCAVPAFPAFTDEDRQKQAQSGEFGARRDFSSLKEIWELVPGGLDEPDVLWAGTIPGGLFRSRDRGTSWEMIRSLWDREDRWKWFGGGKDHPGIHSITVDPRNSQHVTVAISCGGVWVTEDAGDTWSPRAKGMRAAYMPPELAEDPNAQDPHRLARCQDHPDSVWVQHHNGIFYSRDGGRQWHEATDVKPSVFGFAVVAHPHDPLTAWFVPAVKDECRVPVDGKFVVTRTRDGGKTFSILNQGLPTEPSYDLVYRHCLDIDATGNRLAMGSTTGGLWVTDDGGDHWQTISRHLPPIHCVRFA